MVSFSGDRKVWGQVSKTPAKKGTFLLSPGSYAPVLFKRNISTCVYCLRIIHVVCLFAGIAK